MNPLHLPVDPSVSWLVRNSTKTAHHAHNILKKFPNSPTTASHLQKIAKGEMED